MSVMLGPDVCDEKVRHRLELVGGAQDEDPMSGGMRSLGIDG